LDSYVQTLARTHTHTHTHTHTRQSISNEIKSDFIEICHKTAFQNLLNYRVCEMILLIKF